ncbi:uncharacterized protein LOC110958431 isoform X1 [Acanthochromis polyacanthus]|uniref:uncharacterized protein LOC110958431 isoform X1 n=1 Tax=Acanthochromis polyacanthus TaxID=80966 RepID=UPI002234C90D|nr:uncharacterized protein LOC110958431 isoform X1 [Acanthochromis polyacanthus]
MCSVVGCDSLRRSAQRFKLPEDPERRLEWVQFLATVNKQRFKESSWTDITICREHFNDDCFVQLTDTVQLKPGSVPTVSPQSEDPEPDLGSSKCEECVDNTDVIREHDPLRACDGPAACSEDSRPTSLGNASQEGPAHREVSSPDDPSDALISTYNRTQPRNVNRDLIRKKAALLKMTGKFVVNEKRLLQLFSSKCPSCGGELEMNKVTRGLLVIVDQQCLQCSFTYQWKSQADDGAPATEDKHLTGGSEAAATDDTHSGITGVPEIVAVIDEESDPMNETEESSEPGDMDSDEDWKPMKDFLPLGVRPIKPNEESKDAGEEEAEDHPSILPQHSQLCTDCGKFLVKESLTPVSTK